MCAMCAMCVRGCADAMMSLGKKNQLAASSGSADIRTMMTKADTTDVASSSAPQDKPSPKRAKPEKEDIMDPRTHIRDTNAVEDSRFPGAGHVLGSDPLSGAQPEGQCPICGVGVSMQRLQAHVDACIARIEKKDDEDDVIVLV